MNYLNNQLSRIPTVHHSEMINPKTNHVRIPDEILLNIAKNLELAELFNLRRVNKKWRAIIDEPTIHFKEMNQIVSEIKQINIRALQKVDINFFDYLFDLYSSGNHFFNYKVQIEKDNIDKDKLEITFGKYLRSAGKTNSILLSATIEKEEGLLDKLRGECILIPRFYLQSNTLKNGCKVYIEICMKVIRFVNNKFRKNPTKIKLALLKLSGPYSDASVSIM